MNQKFYSIRYHLATELECGSPEEYINTYYGKIYEGNVANDDEELIGKVTLKFMLLDMARNDHYSFYEIFDHDAYTAQIADQIIDFEEQDIKSDILDYYGHEVSHGDVCLITCFEMVESHRGQSIGQKVMRDIASRFGGNCGLFVVQALPIQFEKKDPDYEPSDWDRRMQLQNLETDYEMAYYKLKGFYRNLGFDHIEGYDAFMFMNPALKHVTSV